MMGESGIGWPGNDFFGFLEKPNDGDWFHDLLWSQLNPGAVSHPNYWWSQHLKLIDAAAISKSFTLFIQDLGLNDGGYQDAAPVINNPVVSAVGQKNLQLDRAHLWIYHTNHTWSNLVGVNGGQAPGGETATLQIQMNPNVQYQIQWWDTVAGQAFLTTTAAADGAGLLSLSFSELRSDVAIKIFK
jgi:hypothetical protein